MPAKTGGVSALGSMRRSLSVCLFMLLWFIANPAVGVTHLQFLYINASEDSASGGHAALKLGDEVFHFEHVPPGLLRIRRDDYAQFREDYLDRQNRTIHIHPIEVSEQTKNLLREQFNRILLIEDEQFDRREALEQDRRLLQSLLEIADENKRLELSGAGLFFADGRHFSKAVLTQNPKAGDGTLAHLASRVEATYGDGFLHLQANKMLAQLKRLQPMAYGESIEKLAEDRFQAVEPSFSRRYADALSAWVSLHVLALGLPLREGVLLRPSEEAFRLNAAEIQGLVRYRNMLEHQLVELLQSKRSDWGFPLFLGMARLIAMDESIATGELVLLSRAKPSSAHPPMLANPVESGQGLHAQSLASFSKAKLVLAGTDTLDEWAYLQLEQTANVLVEIQQAVREGRAVSLDGLLAVPAYSASVELIQPDDVSVHQLQARLNELEAYLSKYQDGLANLYAYNLLGRNCANEIFRVVNQAMRKAAMQTVVLDGFELMERDKQESSRRLGGYISGEGLEFIPFMSFQIVGERWRASVAEIEPAYRHRQLDLAKQKGNPFWVSLRESNVFSSSIYRWHDEDPAFIFFTDDLLWARPLAGGFNLAAGVAQAVTGLIALPWDQGENLRLGMKGLLLSLPELFFFNIRKGSFPELIHLGE